MRPTPEQIDVALRAHASERGPGWVFDTSGYVHTDTQARALVESCLLLGVPVTDILSSTMWRTLITRLVAAEERIDALETHQ